MTVEGGDVDDKPAPKRKGGRKPILDPELVAAAIMELRGNLSAVAQRFNVHRSSVSELIEKRPTLQRILQDTRETRTDTAEDRLGDAIDKGEAWAVCFYLKTQGKARGYVERQEITGKDGGAIRTEITEEIVDADHPKDDPPPSDPGSISPV